MLAALSVTCATAAGSDPDADRWAALAPPVFRLVANRVGGLDGLAHTALPQALAQDATGFLWVATQTGLERWDGYELRKYSAHPGDPCALQAEDVLTVMTDDLGRLWAGTLDGGLSRYDPETDCFRTIKAGPHGLRDGQVIALADDGKGGLWIGTKVGVDHIAADLRQVAHVTLHAGDAPLQDADPILRLLRDRDGALWVGTEEGLMRRGAHDLAFSDIPLTPIGHQSTPIRALMQGSDGQIWIGTGTGRVYVVDPETLSLRELTLVRQLPDVGVVWDAVEAKNGEIWLATNGSGIVIVDPKSLRIRILRHQQGVPTSLLQDSVAALFRDRGGLMWVVSYKGFGYYKVDAATAPILTVDAANDLPDGDVSALALMGDERIAVGSERQISLIEPQRRGVESIALDPDFRIDRVFALATPNGRDLFAGTRPAGLLWIDRSSGRSFRVPLPPERSVQRVYALALDGDRLWVGSRDGVWTVAKDPSAGHSTVPWRAERHIDLPTVYAIAVAPAGVRWFGGPSGLYRSSGDSSNPIQLHLTSMAGEPIDDPFVLSLLIDRRNRLWLGTISRGLFVLDSATEQSASIRVLKHLPYDSASLIEDANGMIWATASSGVARIDPASFEVRLLGRGDGILESDFWMGSAARTSHNELLFGGQDGITLLRPDHLGAAPTPVPIAITGISVADRAVPWAQYNIDGTDRVLDVPAEARSLSVNFAALDFASPEMHSYAYKLDGYDRGWIPTGAENRIARYTNLSPGNYRLTLRSTDGAGVAVAIERELRIHVTAAWYQTVWFHALEIAAVFVVLLTVVQWRTVLLRARQRELEALIEDRTRALVRATGERNSLIENLAHDLRTPLTSLRGYLDRLSIKDEALSESDRGRFVDIAVRQAERLIRLVRELFELVRLDDPLARLTLESFQPAEIVQDVVQEFASIADGRNLNCVLDPGAESAQIIGDISLFQRLIDNLVDNALSHTPAGGTIMVRLGTDAAGIVLEVVDTGRGIDRADLDRIFNRYERGDTAGRNSGAGLGLAIVKRILELHRGSIAVDSEVGLGTRFVVRLPWEGPAAGPNSAQSPDVSLTNGSARSGG